MLLRTSDALAVSIWDTFAVRMRLLGLLEHSSEAASWSPSPRYHWILSQMSPALSPRPAKQSGSGKEGLLSTLGQGEGTEAGERGMLRRFIKSMQHFSSSGLLNSVHSKHVVYNISTLLRYHTFSVRYDENRANSYTVVWRLGLAVASAGHNVSGAPRTHDGEHHPTIRCPTGPACWFWTFGNRDQCRGSRQLSLPGSNLNSRALGPLCAQALTLLWCRARAAACRPTEPSWGSRAASILPRRPHHHHPRGAP